MQDESSKIKVSICSISIETENICSILPRPAVSSDLMLEL